MSADSCPSRRRIIRRSSASSWSVASRIVRSDTLLTALFDQFCDEAGPAGLMACADPGAVVAVKVFVEKDEVAPVRVALKKLGAARYGPAAFRIAEKNMNEPPGNFRGDLPEIGFAAGMRGALNFEIFPEVVVKFLERFHKQIVDRKPNRPAPVRISAEQARRGFGRLVIDAVRISVHVNFVRMVLMEARKGAHAVRRKEFRFIQHAAEHALELLAVHEGQQPPHSACRTLRHFYVFGHVRM